MKLRRKRIIAFGAGALTVPFGSFAQQSAKVWRIGYLDFGTNKSMMDSGRYAAMIDGLRERGYIEGRNFVLEARSADGNLDRLDGPATELVRQKVDLILTMGNAAGKAATRATTTIPIVATNVSNPVGDGFAVSLARPGGNMTGLSAGTDDTVQKLVELLSVAVPKIKHLAVLTNPTNIAHASMLLRVQAAAKQAGKQVLQVSAYTMEEIERGFAEMARKHVDAVIVLADAILTSHRAQIAGLAVKHRLPSIYPFAVYPEAGGLMSYGADMNDNFRRAGIFVDKILKGAKPGDLPFEQPTRYYLVINRKTASAIGLTLPQSLLISAEKVIE